MEAVQYASDRGSPRKIPTIHTLVDGELEGPSRFRGISGNDISGGCREDRVATLALTQFIYSIGSVLLFKEDLSLGLDRIRPEQGSRFFGFRQIKQIDSEWHPNQWRVAWDCFKQVWLDFSVELA